MKLKKVLSTAILPTVLFLSSCTVVKDTAGMKQYLEDQGKVVTLANDLKSQNTPASNEYKQIKKDYESVVEKSESWTKDTLEEIRTSSQVDITLEKYNSSDAQKEIQEFLSSNERMSLTGVDPATVTQILKFVADFADSLNEQHNKAVAEATANIENKFKEAKWPNFDEIDDDWVSKKYPE